MKIIIHGELTDLNAFLKATNTNRYTGAKLKRSETERVAWQAKRAQGSVNEYPVDIHYDWYSKNARKDIDNVSFARKFVNDGLVMAGVLSDDSRKYIGGMSESFPIDKENPRVEVTITTPTKIDSSA